MNITKKKFDKCYNRWQKDFNDADFAIVFQYLFDKPYIKQENSMPNPSAGETEQEYVSRFMESAEARKDFPDSGQRAAVAYSKWRQEHGGKKPEEKKDK